MNIIDQAVFHVDIRFLDQIWPLVSDKLDKALKTGEGEMTIDQARMFLVRGQGDLFVARPNGNIEGVCLVEWMQYPNYRVAHVIALSGKGMKTYRDQLFYWLKQAGASKVRAFCKTSQARLYRMWGFQETYTLMNADI